MTKRPARTTAKTLPYRAEARALMRAGDVLLFRGSTWFSTVIESVERGTYSHAALVLEWNGRIMIARAEWPRLEAVPTSVAVKGYPGRVDWFRFRREAHPEFDLEALALQATSKLGCPYAVKDLVRVGFYNLFGRPVPPQPADDFFFCSEYVAWAFDRAGLPLVGKRNHVAVTPDDLSHSDLLEPIATIEDDSRRGR